MGTISYLSKIIMLEHIPFRQNYMYKHNFSALRTSSPVQRKQRKKFSLNKVEF